MSDTIDPIEQLGFAHRAMLDRRDSLIQHANDAVVDGDSVLGLAVDAFSDAENEIVALPAASTEGSFVKMLVLLQQISMGHEVTDDTAWPVAEEAARLIGSKTLAGLGYLSPENQRAHEAVVQGRTASDAPDEADPWQAVEDQLRRVDAEWEAIGDDYTNEEAERVGDLHTAAIQKMMATPARTAFQAIRKIEVSLGDCGTFRTDTDSRALLDEAKRLASGEA